MSTSVTQSHHSKSIHYSYVNISYPEPLQWEHSLSLCQRQVPRATTVRAFIIPMQMSVTQSYYSKSVHYPYVNISYPELLQ